MAAPEVMPLPLPPKPPPKLGGDHAHVVERHAEHFGDLLAHRKGRLGVGPDGEPAVRFHLRRGDARLQILRMDHLGFVNFVDDHVGFGHRFLGIADMDGGEGRKHFSP